MNTNLPNGFSLDNARFMAVQSERAYQPLTFDPLQPKLITREITDSTTDTRVIITWFDDYIVVAVRGTKDLRNWLVNLDVLKKVLSGRIKVHAGFLKAANALLQKLLAVLLPDAGTDKWRLKPIYITGHSLGGALASLLAFALYKQDFPIQGVYTFASPRVGNAAWRRAYQGAVNDPDMVAWACSSMRGRLGIGSPDTLGDRTFRLVASGDLVPLLPGLCAGYRHVGQEVFLDGKIWLHPSRILEIATDSWRAGRAFNRFDWDFLLQVHSLAEDYYPLLNRNSQSPMAN